MEDCPRRTEMLEGDVSIPGLIICGWTIRKKQNDDDDDDDDLKTLDGITGLETWTWP